MKVELLHIYVVANSGNEYGTKAIATFSLLVLCKEQKVFANKESILSSI